VTPVANTTQDAPSAVARDETITHNQVCANKTEDKTEVTGQLLPLLSSTSAAAAGGDAGVAACASVSDSSWRQQALRANKPSDQKRNRNQSAAGADAVAAACTSSAKKRQKQASSLASASLNQQQPAPLETRVPSPEHIVTLVPNTTQDAPSAVARDETTTHNQNGGKQTVGPELAVLAANTLPSTHLATKSARQIERAQRREQATAEYDASQKQIVQLKQEVPRLQNGVFTGTRTAYNKSHVITLALNFKAYHAPVYAPTILDSWVFVVERNIDSIYSNSIILNFESIHPLHAIIHGNPRTNTWFIAPGTDDSNIVVKVNGVLVVFGKPVQMHENAQVVLGKITVTFNMVQQS